MFFILSQIFDFFVTPSSLIALLGFTGLMLQLARRRRAGAIVLATSTVLLLIGGFSPIGALTLGILENRFPPANIEQPPFGIILLGGAVDIHISSDRNAISLSDAAERVTATMQLAQQFPEARILLSGGAGHLSHQDDSISESDWTKTTLVGMGLPEERIEVDNNSRNTCENATESKALASPVAGQRWILVTSASHMPRAVACFRSAGFDVVPFPVDYRTRQSPGLLTIPTSPLAGLTMLDLAAHEWVGLLTYKISGMTSDWFPGP